MALARALLASARWCGVLLYRLGLHGLIIHLRRRRVRVLLYHDCALATSPFTEGLQSTIHPSDFARHLEFVRKHYNVVDLKTATADERGERLLVITFDDGYRSVLTHAAPLLEAFGLPAVNYLVSDVVGNNRLVWVNELNWLLHMKSEATRPIVASVTGLPESASTAALVDAVRVRCRPELIERVISEATAASGVDRGALARDARLYLTWEEVDQLRRRGIEFGNHTASHPSLARLTASEQHAEIASARDMLISHGLNGTALACPFGDISPDTRAVAESAGMLSVSLVGEHPGPFDRLAIGRVACDSRATVGELFAEVEVVEPLKAFLRRLTRKVG